MTITIPNEKEFDDDFIFWIIKKVRNNIFSSVNDKKFKRIDEYINGNKLFITPFKKVIVSKEVLQAALYNMKVHKYWDRIVIGFDDNAIIPNTKTKFVIVLKLINFGTLSVLGYPIITKEFKYIEEHLDELYQIYTEEL